MGTQGIDLGTTYSCIAYIDQTGRPVVAKSAAGEDTTPSVVYFESPSNVVVGRDAKNSSMISPDEVISLIKRQIGQDVSLTFHGEPHTPETISALILRELVRASTEQTGEPVEDVVISVPAYFGLAEREATRRAGEIAGFTVLDVIPEPVAAALHYQALRHSDEPSHILVYDLGGGTFDTTVIRLQGNDVTVVCTDGDNHLGGADWDGKLMDHLLDRFTREHPDLDPGGDEQFLQGLAEDVERLKCALSTKETTRHNMRFDGAVTTVELSRADVEELTADLLERTMTATDRTVWTAREKGVTAFDEVLLVGGMTRMPVVARTLTERLGQEVKLHEPNLAVAKGAALYAMVSKVRISLDAQDGSADPEADMRKVARDLGMPTEQVRELAETHIATVVPRAFGVLTVDTDDPMFRTDPDQAREYVEHLLHADTPLPADTGAQGFKTIFDNQNEVRVQVWEQAGTVASQEKEHNSHVGEGMLTGLPPGPAGAPFNVNFLMSETGLLHVRAWQEDTGNEVRFEIQIAGLTQADVTTARNAIARYQVSG